MSAPDRMSKEQMYHHIRDTIERWAEGAFDEEISDELFEMKIVAIDFKRRILTESAQHRLASSLAEFAYDAQDNR